MHVSGAQEVLTHKGMDTWHCMSQTTSKSIQTILSLPSSFPSSADDLRDAREERKMKLQKLNSSKPLSHMQTICTGKECVYVLLHSSVHKLAHQKAALHWNQSSGTSRRVSSTVFHITFHLWSNCTRNPLARQTCALLLSYGLKYFPSPEQQQQSQVPKVWYWSLEMCRVRLCFICRRSQNQSGALPIKGS